MILHKIKTLTNKLFNFHKVKFWNVWHFGLGLFLPFLATPLIWISLLQRFVKNKFHEPEHTIIWCVVQKYVPYNYIGSKHYIYIMKNINNTMF